MHPATWAAFTVEPRHEIFLKKISLLCNFSATAAVSSISLHNLKSSPESTYRAVEKVPPLSMRGVDDPGDPRPMAVLHYQNQIFVKKDGCCNE